MKFLVTLIAFSAILSSQVYAQDWINLNMRKLTDSNHEQTCQRIAAIVSRLSSNEVVFQAECHTSSGPLSLSMLAVRALPVNVTNWFGGSKGWMGLPSFGYDDLADCSYVAGVISSLSNDDVVLRSSCSQYAEYENIDNGYTPEFGDFIGMVTHLVTSVLVVD